MKNILMVATIFCLISVVYLGMNTYPDIKILTLFGFQIGINYNEFMLLKLLTLCFSAGYFIFKYGSK